MKIFADQIHYVKLKITLQNVNAQPDLKVIPYQNKAAFVYHQHVYQRVDARTDTCALGTFVKYHARIPSPVLLVNVAITMFARKYVTQIIIACLVKFVMNAVHVKPVV